MFLLIAAGVLVTYAGIQGSRFDGWAELHPMHPVHLIGHDGSYHVAPLAWIDPQAVAFTRTAVVRSTEGPWLELDRAPLTRQGRRNNRTENSPPAAGDPGAVSLRARCYETRRGTERRWSLSTPLPRTPNLRRRSTPVV